MDIFDAIRNGDVERVKELIATGIDLDLKDGYNINGNTALISACMKKNVEIVKLLLDAGANPNVKNLKGEAPIITKSSLEIGKLLLDAGADPNIRNGKGTTALMYKRHIFPLLFEYGADPNIVDDKGNTALIYHLETNQPIQNIKLLLEHKANPNIKGGRGKTSLMFAKSLNIAKLLLEYGADPNIADNYGITALMRQVGEERIEIVRLLLEKGVNINAVNSHGNSALSYATTFEIVQLLLEYGADSFHTTDCSTKDCEELLDSIRWKRLYERDKNLAARFSKNTEIFLPKEIWEIILLNKRQQQLCKDLTTNKNKGVLILFALELGIKVTDNMSKANICGLISNQLAYGKHERSQNEFSKKLKRAQKDILAVAMRFNIDTNQPLSTILQNIEKMIGNV